MVVALMAGGAAVAAVLVAFLVTPARMRRGLAAGLCTFVAAFAGARTAPGELPALAPIAVGALMVVGSVTGTRRDIRRAAPVLTLLVILAAVSFVTTAAVFPVGAGLAARLAFASISTVVCVAGFTPEDRRLFTGWLVALAGVEALLGILEATLTHRPIPWGFKVRQTGVVMLRNPILPGGLTRVSGSLGHPIPYAVTIATGLVLLVVDHSRGRALRTTVLLPLFVAAIVLSGSRSVLLAVGAALLYCLTTGAQRSLPVRLVLLGLSGLVAALLVGDVVGEATSRFVSSGSYENRANSMSAVPGLLQRPLAETLFGSGFGSDSTLFDRGFFVNLGLHVIDNQFVTTLATQGLVGAALSVATIVVAWGRAGRTARALLVVFVAMTFSFDYLAWPSMAVLLGVAFVVPDRTPTPEHEPARGALPRAGHVVRRARAAAAPARGHARG